MASILKITNNIEWEKMMFKHMISGAERIHMQNLGNIFAHPYPAFPLATHLKFENCHRNFVYYWMHERTFPAARYIDLFSHPCESVVLLRFPDARIRLSQDFKRYKTRWASNQGNVTVVE